MWHEPFRYGTLSSGHGLSIQQTSVNVIAKRALVAVVIGPESQ